MRIVKDADERKNEILDVAETLFIQKGFDGTSISDIIEKVGVARGTVYYHFKSKEDVLNAIIERQNTQFLANAKIIAADKSIPVFERMFKTLAELARSDVALTEHLHKPQNALMHQKSHKAMLTGIPPILADIVEDGIKEGLFHTPYPYESIEMVIAHIITVFDDDDATNLSAEEQFKKIEAFIFNMDRIFGAAPGSFAPIIQMFQSDGGGENE